MVREMNPRLLASLAVVLGLALWPAGAGAAPQLETAQLGEVRAELSYDREDLEYRDVRLKVTRAGRTLVDEPVAPPCAGCPVRPAGQPPDTSSIAVRRLDGGPEPEVILDLYTGGAYCCVYSVILRYDAATDRYARVRRNWGSAGYRLRNLGGGSRPEFDSRDARFDSAFTARAVSLQPPRVFRFQGGRLVDVTRRFRALVAADARSAGRLLRRLQRDRIDPRGALAAYVADKHLLGQGRAGWRVAYRALRRGHLDRYALAGQPTGRAFLRDLRRALRRWGYTGS